MNAFLKAVQKRNTGRPPVWFMRQAGRYHSHYQAIRAKYSFMEMCKNPEIAADITMGPIDDFGFDAAILFSDLLFPLEAMGMGLKYEPGPQLGWHLRSREDLNKLRSGASLAQEMTFQAEALKEIRTRLSPDKGLIGFVGAPMTLFYYAAVGSHQGGQLGDAQKGLVDGRYEGFCERLLPLLAENMALQARAGADVIALFDTCAGEVEPSLYHEVVLPPLRQLLKTFKEKCPDTPVIYYSKKTTEAHWDGLDQLPISVLGIDWKTPLEHVLVRRSKKFAIQGNVDPEWLFLQAEDLEARLRRLFDSVKRLPAEHRQGWICGLGHGVLPGTPESNVRLFLRLQKEIFERG